MRDKWNADWKPGDPIQYVRAREDIPAFDLPPYAGQRYQDRVPDTLDLAERAALAIHAMTSVTDPLADYEIYWQADLRHNPPMMQHDFSDQCQVKFMEALPLLRTVSGSDENLQVERRWMEVALQQQAEDGLLYTPLIGRPWQFKQMLQFHLGVTGDVPEQIIDPFYSGRMLTAMMRFYRHDKNELWRESAVRIIAALDRLAVKRGDSAYFSPTTCYAVPGETRDYGPDNPMAAIHVAFVALGLVHAYREIGYEPALKLAGRLLHYALTDIRCFGDDGRFAALEPPRNWAHFHMHTYTLLTTLEYARATGNRDLLELVRRGYEFAKANGNVLLGYFPEQLYSDRFEHSELCEVADMLTLAVKMTDEGMGDYLDDADRWVRNMFAEGQLTPEKVSWLEHYAAKQPISAVDPTFQCTDNVLARNVGAFAGWPAANDWYHYPRFEWHCPGIMHCCTGNASRALYYVWDKILSFEAGKLRVNLLLNRASPWADVHSHIPYEGRADVKAKQALSLSVRIPEWVTPGPDVRVRVNERERDVTWDGRYAAVGDLQAGEQATLTFPIEERAESIWVQKEHFHVVRKGNDVVAMNPQGTTCPLYQRAHYRGNRTRFHEVSRFVLDEAFSW